jgi:hypothetical protein
MTRTICILGIVVALFSLGLLPRITLDSPRGFVERSTTVPLGVWVVGLASTLASYTLWKGR